MHVEALEWVGRCLPRVDPLASVLEFGSRDINGTPRCLVQLAAPGATYLGVDMREGQGVDVVADAAVYRALRPVDLVICTEVLEHAPDPAGIVANAAANLHGGGHLVLTCAGPRRPRHSGIVEGAVQPGEHYGAPTLAQLREWAFAAGLDVLAIEEADEPNDLRLFARKP